MKEETSQIQLLKEMLLKLQRENEENRVAMTTKVSESNRVLKAEIKNFLSEQTEALAS